jgi:hypothetical protein
LISILTGVVVFFVSKIVTIKSLVLLIAIGGFGACFYFGLLLVFQRKEIVQDIVTFKNLLFST